MQSVPTAAPELTASVDAEARFRAEMVKLVEHQANSGKSIVLSPEKFAAIVAVLKHPEESLRKYSSQFRSWVRYRGFKLLDFPELGQSDVLVRPACLDSKLIRGDGPEYLTVLQAPDLYDAVKHVHTKVFQHGGYKRVLDYMQRHYYGVTRGYVQQFVGACPVCRTLRPNSATNFRPGPKPAPSSSQTADPDARSPCLEIDVAAPQELDLAGPLQVVDLAETQGMDVDPEEMDFAQHDAGFPLADEDTSNSGEAFTGDITAASTSEATDPHPPAEGDDRVNISASDPDSTSCGLPGVHGDTDGRDSKGGDRQTRDSGCPEPGSSTVNPGQDGSVEKRVSRTIVEGNHVYVVTLNEDNEEADGSAVPSDEKKNKPREAGTKSSDALGDATLVIKQEPADDSPLSSATPSRPTLSTTVHVKRAELGGRVPAHDVTTGTSPRRAVRGGVVDSDTERRLARKRSLEQLGVLGDRAGASSRAARTSLADDKERGLAQPRDCLWRNTSVTSLAPAGRQFPPTAPRVFISVGSASLPAKKSPANITAAATMTTTTTTNTSITSLAVEPYRCDVTPRPPSPDNDDTSTTMNNNTSFFSVIHLDIIDMSHAPDGGNHFIAHVTDPSRKLHVLFPLPTSSAPAVAAALDQRVLALYGMPGTLCSNRGHQFVEDVLTALARLVEGGITCANGEPSLGSRKDGGAAGRAQRTNVVEELISLLRMERGSDPRTGGVPWLSWLPRIMRSLNRDWHANLRANSAPLAS